MASQDHAFQWGSNAMPSAKTPWGSPLTPPIIVSTTATSVKPASLYDHAVVGECSAFHDLIMGVVRNELGLFWDAVLWPALRDLKADLKSSRTGITPGASSGCSTAPGGIGDSASFLEPAAPHIDVPPSTSVPTPPMQRSRPASRPASAGGASSCCYVGGGAGSTASFGDVGDIAAPALSISRSNAMQVCNVSSMLASPTVPPVVGQRKISDSWPAKGTQAIQRPSSPLMRGLPPLPHSSQSRRRVAPEIVKNDIVPADNFDIDQSSRFLFGIANRETEDLDPSDSSDGEPGAPMPNSRLTSLRVSAPRDPPPALLIAAEERACLDTLENKATGNIVPNLRKDRPTTGSSSPAVEEAEGEKSSVKLHRGTFVGLTALRSDGQDVLDRSEVSSAVSDSEANTPTPELTPRKRGRSSALASHQKTVEVEELHQRLSMIGLSSGKTLNASPTRPLTLVKQVLKGDAPLLQLVESGMFDNLSAFLILANAVTIGAQTNYMAQHSTEDVPKGWEVADKILAIAFLLELIIRLRAFGCREFFTGADMKWNIFDFTSVAVQTVEELLRIVVNIVSGFGSDLSNLKVMRMMRILRLTRVVRVARVLRLINELRCIVASVVGSLRSLGWTVVLLTLLMFMVGVYFTQTVTDYVINVGKDNADPVLYDNFRGVWYAILVLYQAVSGGIDWKTLSDALLVHIGVHATVGFMVYIAFVVLCILNVVTGVFVDSALKNAIKEDFRLLSRNVKCIFDCADMDGNASLDISELRLLLAHGETRNYMLSVGIDPEDVCTLFSLMDIDGTGEVNSSNLMTNCLKLRGQPSSMDVLTALWETRRFKKDLHDIKRMLSDRR